MLSMAGRHGTEARRVKAHAHVRPNMEKSLLEMMVLGMRLGFWLLDGSRGGQDSSWED